MGVTSLPARCRLLPEDPGKNKLGLFSFRRFIVFNFVVSVTILQLRGGVLFFFPLKLGGFFFFFAGEGTIFQSWEHPFLKLVSCLGLVSRGAVSQW